MIISHTHRYIFIKSTKTAGTSVEAALSNYCSGEDVVTPLGDYSVNRDETGAWVHKSMNAGGHKQHDDALTIRGSVPPDVWNGYFKFSIARNPWERTLSRFFWNRRNDPALKPGSGILRRVGLAHDDLRTARKLFREFVLGDGLQTNDRFYIIDGRLCVDQVIRYESLVTDLGEVCRRVGVPDVALPNLKAGIRNRDHHYSAYYDDEIRAVVAERHRSDIELFGYRFEILS